MVLTLCLVFGCSGGGSGSGGATGQADSSSGGSGQGSTWTRSAIKVVTGGGMLIPQVKAAVGTGNTVHFAYFTDSDTTPGDFTVNHVLWSLTSRSEVSHSEVMDIDNCRTLDLAVASGNAPVVAYQGGEVRAGGSEQQSDVMISVFSGNAWHEYTGGIGFVERNPVFTDGLAGKQVTLALDAEGDIHLGYQFFYEGIDALNFNYPDLLYVEKDASSLAADAEEETAEGNVYNDNGTASEQNRVGACADILIDAQGNPAIVYYADLDPDSSNTATKGLRIAYRVSGVWQCEWIETGFEVGGISAALDGNGNICVAYYVEGEYTDGLADHEKCLKYARKSGASWVKTLVDETTQCGKYPSLAFDSSGYPAIAYYSQQNHSGSVTYNDLRLARFNGTTWSRETVSSDGDIGSFNTLWFGGSGTTCISTFSNTDHTIYLFTR